MRIRGRFYKTQLNGREGSDKRDRLVWIGDMQPEVLAITDLFGGHPLAEKAIEESVEKIRCRVGSATYRRIRHGLCR